MEQGHCATVPYSCVTQTASRPGVAIRRASQYAAVYPEFGWPLWLAAIFTDSAAITECRSGGKDEFFASIREVLAKAAFAPMKL